MTIQIASKALTEENIKDISVNLKIDEISATLPIDEMAAEICCDQSVADLFTYNAEFKVYDNAEQIGVFYARKPQKTGTNSYSLRAVSIVGVLAERNFSGKYFAMGTEFAEALAEIISDDIPYIIEDESEAFEVEGFIGHCSQREAVRHLCMACGVTVYNNKGVLTFRRAFGGNWGGTIDAEYSYQQDEVFDDYTVDYGTMYSHYSVETFFFVQSEKEQYVTDTQTGTKYYYYTEKVTIENEDYPEGRPKNELYIQGEKLVSGYNPAFRLLDNLAQYYKGGKTLKFRVIDTEPKNYGVGFFDNERMIFGYPSEINISYGKNQVYGRLNSIEYNCPMAYYEEPRNITVNYKTEAGDLLTTKTIVKGSEGNFTVKHPVISLIIDNRHKIIYTTPDRKNEYEDDVYSDPVDIDVVCQIALIQDGEIIEVYAADEATQFDDTIYIGGTVNG